MVASIVLFCTVGSVPSLFEMLFLLYLHVPSWQAFFLFKEIETGEQLNMIATVIFVADKTSAIRF